MSVRPGGVSHLIDDILRLNRDETERQISGYRLFVFTFALALGLVVMFTRAGSWVPVIYWGSCVGYGLLFRQLIKRHGAHPAITVAGLILDLTAMAMLFVVADALSGGMGRRAENLRWPLYVLPVSLYTFLLINSLRASALTAVVGAVWAAGLFLGISVYFDGLHIQQLVAAAIFLASSWLGLQASARARQSLDRFARFQLLRRYLPTAAVERVLTENPDDALALGGDLLTVTILAADLRNFTAMSEKLAPGEVVRQLNAYHGAMLEVIERHGGMLDKFIGDGTLVVFGLERVVPLRMKDAGATAALACARDMLATLGKLNEDRAKAGQRPLAMGIGIHTGPVVAGNIGAPGRRIEFTVVGDTVNTASRLEGLTKECGHAVVLSSATAALLDSRDGLLELSPMKLKGKDQPLNVYGVDAAVQGNAAAPTPASPPPLARSETV